MAAGAGGTLAAIAAMSPNSPRSATVITPLPVETVPHPGGLLPGTLE
jgi:hypothetical protein